MPRIDSTPKNLMPYRFYGLDFEYADGEREAMATCLFCGKEKFSINAETGLWKCWSCGEGSSHGGGNLRTFLVKLWEECPKDPGSLESLAENRGVFDPESLIHWGVRKSVFKDEYLVAAWNPEGNKIQQLYRYTPGKDRWLLLACPGMVHQLFGTPLYDPKKPFILLCEGPWDAIVLWEALRRSKADNADLFDLKGLKATANPKGSLISLVNVLATPGANVFNDQWADLFSGKRIAVLYDNDYLDKRGSLHPGAGYAGMRRVACQLAGAGQAPQEIRYLKWFAGEGDKDAGYNESLPSGYDVRDHLTSGEGVSGRVKKLGELIDKVVAIPQEWLGSRSAQPGRIGEVELLECTRWEVLVESWKKALMWIEGLDRALSVMLASVATTELVGQQLWIKVVAPPSSAKSTLCEALATCKRYILSKSTFRGFHSGFKQDFSNPNEDNSLLAQARNKTFIIKDGDTLLQSPNLPQILSEGRDIYDRVSRTHYRNKASRDYEGLNMTWIICGTSSLRQLDSSELGERFLDCVIMEEIDEDVEDEISWCVAKRAVREMDYISDGKLDTRDVPEIVEANRLTGGYAKHLRENIHGLTARVEFTDGHLRVCQKLGKFVACMRARPSRKQEEKAEREMSSRLVSQLVRLSKALAVVLNRQAVDEEVMRRVRRTAMDTARGRVLEIVKHLYAMGRFNGSELQQIAEATHNSADKEAWLLGFLRKIKVVERFEKVVTGGGKRRRWRLTERMTKLYHEVVVKGGE